MPVLLAGCSSSDSPANAATSSAGTSQSSAAATSAATDADATRAQGAMDEAVARISAVEPPAEATPQWTRLVTAWTAMRYLPAQPDLTRTRRPTRTSPTRLQALQTELVDSRTAVDDYGNANC